MLNKKFSKGFSLVELMIVVAAVAILAAVAIPAYFNHVLRTRQADAYHNLLDIKAAQEMFFSQFNEYAGPDPLISASSTFTSLLSFQFSDTQYYRYVITSASDTAFTAVAQGKYKKLIGNEIRITDKDDPCIVSPGDLKQSLGLTDCP